MPIVDRSTLLGAGLGVALLAGAVGFGVGLPEVTGSPDAEAATAALPALPDRIDDTMVALSAVTPEDAGARTPEDEQLVTQLATAAEESDLEAAERLSGLYGEATVRAYVDVQVMADTARQNPPAQMSVTVVPGEAGLVIPSGPFRVDQDGSHYELQKVGGHTCAFAWREQLDPTTGQPTGGEPAAASYQAECRAERDGLAYDVYSTGIAPDALAGYLDKVLELTAEG